MEGILSTRRKESGPEAARLDISCRPGVQTRRWGLLPIFFSWSVQILCESFAAHVAWLPLQRLSCAGIDPRDLMFAEIWQFAEPNVSEEIQLMRHSAYMQLREEKMDTVVRARDGILSAKAHREALSKAVESKVKPPKIPPRVSSSGPNKGLVAHEVNIALLRAKAMEARRFESMDASVKVCFRVQHV